MIIFNSSVVNFAGNVSRIDMAIWDGYNEDMKISVAEAKNRLPELIKSVEAGELITICRRGLPVVDIVPTKARSVEKPKFGSLRGKIAINDSDWWQAMSEHEAKAFSDGNY